MLTKNEKVKIRLEEAYRLEVRDQLQKDSQKKPSEVWSFLNSSFGLWLLSAIFITGAGVLYTNYQNSRTERLKNEEVIQKLDLEISYRYSQILIQLYNLTDLDSNGQYVLKRYGTDDVIKVLNLLNEQPKVDSDSLYPEYSKMGIPALIAELRRHLQSENERLELDKTLAVVTGGVFEDVNFLNVQQIAGSILEKQMLPRWKKGYFFFINCPTSDPFKAKGLC